MYFMGMPPLLLRVRMRELMSHDKTLANQLCAASVPNFSTLCLMAALAGLLRFQVPAGGINSAAGFIPVTVAHPVGQGERRTGFVAALGRVIDIDVCPQCPLISPRVAGIGVEDLSGLVFVKDAEPRHFHAPSLAKIIILVHLATGKLLLRERNVIIVIEIASE